MNKKIIIASLMIIIIMLTLKGEIYNVKIEYEKLNNKKEYIKVKIPKDNPFQNISSNEFTKKLKESSVIFIGTTTSKVSRNSINLLSKAAESTGINKIYYIDKNKIKDKEIIKKYKIDEGTLLVFKNGKLESNIQGELNKKELVKKYEDAINKTLTCNSTKDTC